MTCTEFFFQSLFVLIGFGTLAAAVAAGWCAFKTWEATKVEHEHFKKRVDNERLINSPVFEAFTPGTIITKVVLNGSELHIGDVVGDQTFLGSGDREIGAILNEKQGKDTKTRRHLILTAKRERNAPTEYEVEFVSGTAASDFRFERAQIVQSGFKNLEQSAWAASYLADPRDKSGQEIVFRLKFITEAGVLDDATFHTKVNEPYIERIEPRQLGVAPRTGSDS
jgi:hypothetical protein